MSSEADEWRELGARLREIREYLNLSQADVAAATGDRALCRVGH
jgi:DNA-binding XRE family transcriptional regulator